MYCMLGNYSYQKVTCILKILTLYELLTFSDFNLWIEMLAVPLTQTYVFTDALGCSARTHLCGCFFCNMYSS